MSKNNSRNIALQTTLYILSHHVGLTPAEIAVLRLSNLRLAGQEPTLTFKTAPGAPPKKVVLDLEAHRVLVEWLVARPDSRSAYLFPADGVAGMSATEIETEVATADVNQLNIPQTAPPLSRSRAVRPQSRSRSVVSPSRPVAPPEPSRPFRPPEPSRPVTPPERSRSMPPFVSRPVRPLSRPEVGAPPPGMGQSRPVTPPARAPASEPEKPAPEETTPEPRSMPPQTEAPPPAPSSIEGPKSAARKGDTRPVPLDLEHATPAGQPAVEKSMAEAAAKSETEESPQEAPINLTKERDEEQKQATAPPLDDEKPQPAPKPAEAEPSAPVNEQQSRPAKRAHTATHTARQASRPTAAQQAQQTGFPWRILAAVAGGAATLLCFTCISGVGLIWFFYSADDAAVAGGPVEEATTEASAMVEATVALTATGGPATGFSPLPTPTETTAPPTNTPEPTATPLPTDTPAPPTETPIPEDTPTPAPTNTPTPEPTATPLPQPTATPRLRLVEEVEVEDPEIVVDTPTPEIQYYDAPRLIDPPDGERFIPGNTIILRWEPIPGELGPNEHYAIRLRYRYQGAEVYGGENVKVPEWTLPPDLIRKVDGPDYYFEWFVIVEHIAPDGTVIPITPQSEVRSFTWY